MKVQFSMYFLSIFVIKNNIMKYTYLFIFLLSALFVSAQKAGDFVVIKHNDGNTYQGEIVNINSEIVKLSTKTLGTIELDREDLKSIESTTEKDISKGNLPMHSVFGSRYYFGPSSLGLKKGEGYYQNLLIFYNQVGYGVTDHFTIGASMVPLFLFGGPTPFGLSAKVHTHLADNISISAGFLGGGIIGDLSDDFGDFGDNLGGIGFGTFTLGNRRQNFTLGGGITTTGEGVLNISGQLPLSKKFFLVSENYITQGAWVTITGGRYMFKQVGFDFGLLRPLGQGDIGDFIGFPYIGVTLPFGNVSDYKAQSTSETTKKKKKK
jgi:hypothetical protein